MEGELDSTERASLRNALGAGALAIAVFTVASIGLNPPVVDETLGSGAVLARMPPYPEGHPHIHFYERAFSLGNHVTARALSLGIDREWISLARNGLGLFLALFAPYTAALLFTRRAAFAIGAALLAALEAPCSYDGLYPVLIYPDIYSHGQIGQSLGVLIALAWIGGAARTAGLLTGALPMIHAGLFPPIAAFTALFLGFSRSRPRGAKLRGALACLALGLAACVAFYFNARAELSPAVAIGPYAAPDGDPAAGLGFVRWTDFHRQIPDLTSFGYTFHFLAFAALAFVALRGGRELGARSNGPAAALRWALVLAAVAWGYTLSCALAQRLGVLPYPLLMAMPSRVANLSTILLVPLTMVAVHRAVGELDARARGLAWGALGALALATAIFSLQRVPWASRDHVLTLVWGALLGIGASRWREERRMAFAYALLFALVALALRLGYPHPARHVSLLAGFAASFAALASARFLPASLVASAERAGVGLALGGASLAALVQLPKRGIDFGGQFRCDVLSRDDRRMLDWMRANVAEEEPLVTPVWVRVEMQQKTAHPVLVETETLWMLTYMPELGSAIGPLIRDFFEVDYADEAAVRALSGGGRLTLKNPHWTRVWRERSAERWAELAQQYDFQLVVSPQDTPLHLPCVVDGERFDLYRVPRG